MDSERWRIIRYVFDEIVDKSKTEQLSYLQLECPEDAAIKREVLALLEADSQSDLNLNFTFPFAVSQFLDDDPINYIDCKFGP